MRSRDERVEKAMAELQRVDDARLADLVDGRAANAMFEEVVGMTEPTTERLRRPRRRLAWRVGMAAAVVAVLAAVLAVVNPFGSNGLTLVQQAAAALTPTDGQILHVKMLGEQTNPDGSVVKWSDESWQATVAPYGRRQIETGPDGKVVETASAGDASQVYDAATNTIYAPPAQAIGASGAPVPKVAGVPSLDKIRKIYIQVGPDAQTMTLKMVMARGDGTTVVKRTLDNKKAKMLVTAWELSRRDAKTSATPAPDASPAQSPDVQADPFRAEILSLLQSGKAREDGRLSIDGREAVRLVGPDGEVYIADAVTYAPIELRTTGDGGGTVLRFVVYETLPNSSATKALLSLPAQHPDARVDTDPAHYDAASGRLFPNG